jgi:hypothetical protein
MASMGRGVSIRRPDVSRNALEQIHRAGLSGGLAGLLALASPGFAAPEPPPVSRAEVAPKSRVVVVRDAEATEAYEPRAERVVPMVNQALLALTGKTNLKAGWLSLVKTQDTIGLKVFSSPGPRSGTRPAVVAALVEGLIAAGVPPPQIIVWDKHRHDLRQAGYFEFSSRYGIKVQGCDGAGYDSNTFYHPDRRILGQLVWGDLEFGKQGDNVGLRSYVSKLVSEQMTRIITVAPLLNHNSTAISGNLYSLAMGSVDNSIRFEMDPERLAAAVPEIYALPSLSDRVVLSVTDALVGQYQGEQRTLLHYAKPINEVWMSRDAVALDVLGIQELDRLRRAFGLNPVSTNLMELYHNAALLEIGVADAEHIQIERAASPGHP